MAEKERTQDEPEANPDEVFAERTIDLEPGDRLCLFTDGVADNRDERGDSFGLEHIRELLPGFATNSATKITEQYVTELNRFRGTARQVDDATLVIGEIR